MVAVLTPRCQAQGRHLGWHLGWHLGRHLGGLGLALGLLLSASAGAGQAPGALAYEGSIASVQEALASGAVSCEALVTHYLDRVQAYDQPLGVRAVTVVNEVVLAEARALDETELVSADPVTVVLSKKGWVRAAKGHEVDAVGLSYKISTRPTSYSHLTV